MCGIRTYPGNLARPSRQMASQLGFVATGSAIDTSAEPSGELVPAPAELVHFFDLPADIADMVLSFIGSHTRRHARRTLAHTRQNHRARAPTCTRMTAPLPRSSSQRPLLHDQEEHALAGRQ